MTDDQTYLFRGRDEKLVHLRPTTRPINLDVEIEPGRQDGSSLVGFFRLGEEAGLAPVVTEGSPGGKLALRTTGGFLRPGPNGAFVVEPDADAKGLFTPVSAVEFAAKGGEPAVKVGRLSRSSQIPKIIHQIYLNGPPLPAPLQKGVERLREMNVGWAHRLWSDSEIVEFLAQNFGPEILKRYLRINPRYGAARADLFRYLCVYTFGGVYLDIRSGCAAPLDTFIRPDDEYLLSQWDGETTPQYRGFGLHPELAHIPNGEYQIWHIIAAPGHPFLEQVVNDVLANIDGYHEALDGVGKPPTLRVTGPISYTLSIDKIRRNHSHRFFNAAAAGLSCRSIDGYAHLPTVYALQTTPLIL